ncbi:Similar to Vegetative incompatibility protein HET-E-1; acc. no. Q00808 [Pyronema omphalodes CBS 100304]|uniref:Similar to Vegetative incompatibility protein HET-E-1 acc. no. Q00808 n=1 Tax=Pyronema omphalodes (strain CBS 100304) TaxID=1076935 RepID=U4LJM0_PYROM|nr:Similar to Vegetative incompatibility protein HET-E-1; acc. no. Q00808 [Pyronema omphalodes CBS 100304]
MWLLHTETLTLEPSDGSKNYAILSHCWGDEKVTFDNISTPEASTLPGYHKIKMCCSTAKRYGFDYVWIDTCCIDKRSSTELSEAINSMYKWYAAAELCFVYLDDYTEEDPSVKTQQRAGISESRWFTRGWTLQELLAPKELVFFNSDWEEFGTRSILKGTISKITGIDTNALNGNFGRGQRQGSYSVAQKMAWAAERKTTREEDIAYCLLGIFDICMPIIYGEGMKAFERLQLEIMKFSDDQSILAWRHERDDGIELVADDPLAKHPKYFSLGGSIQYRSALSSSYAMTNIGLNIELPLVPINITEDFVMKTVGKNSGLGSLHFLLKHEAGYQSYMAFLNCTVTGERGRIAIYLWTNDNETFCRVSPGVLVLIHEDIEAINSSLAMHLHVTLFTEEKSILKPKTEAFLPILRDTSRCTIHVKVIEHQGMDDTPNVVSAFISIRDHETYHEASAEQSDIGTPDFDDPDAPDQVFTSSDASEPEDLDSSELPESFRSCIDMEEFCEEAHSDSDFGDPEAADQIFASSDHGDDEDANQPPVSFNFIIAEPELPDESHLTSSAKITKRLRESSAGLPGNPTPNTDVLSRADTSTTLSHSATDMTTAKRLRLGDTI